MELSDPTLFLKAFVDPWYKSIAKPVEAQGKTLATLVQAYAKTEYGEKYGAKNVRTIPDYQSSFPIANYQGLQPWLEHVKQGNYAALLPERVERWVMTRSTTGKSKIRQDPSRIAFPTVPIR